jgi:hypothetical protein
LKLDQEGLKTKLVNKLVAALVLLMFAICITALPVSAKDYSPIEDLGEKVLLDPQFELKIKTADVAIGTSQVVIDYTTSSKDEEEIGNDIGAILGVYKMIVDDYPEVGELLILARSNFGGTPTKFTCQKSWVSSLEGNDATGWTQLASKVMETSKTS